MKSAIWVTFLSSGYDGTATHYRILDNQPVITRLHSVSGYIQILLGYVVIVMYLVNEIG
jgi:hypothetical protein